MLKMPLRVSLCTAALLLSSCTNSEDKACGDVVKSSEVATAQSKLLSKRGDVRQGATYRVISSKIIVNNSQCFSSEAVAEAKLRLGE